MWLNYDETYAVSEDGLVMNRKTGKILKPSADTGGYLIVFIHSNIARVHRIVAQMFCPKIDLPGLEVDHINRDKKDNSAVNLRWCDRSTNERNKPATNISRDCDRDRYGVEFVKNGKRIHRSYHKTLEDATAARDAFRNSEEYRLSL